MELSETQAWIILKAARLSRQRERALLEAFGSAEAVLAASDHELAAVEGMTALHVRKVREAQASADPRAAEDFQEKGWQIVAWTSEAYPAILREIPDPPVTLFVEGDLGGPDEPRVAIVGTRKCTPYGRRMARRLGYELAARGVTVVSGMALGADGEAHDGALEAGGRTLAVLGCGLEVTYPAQHTDLRGRIAAQGAVLSELPLNARPARENFPERNRVISGLSLGVVVVEAPESSGALITARLAAEQGREVFAVPGDVTRPESRGCNQLIRDGATLVQSAEDVIEGLGVQLAAPAPAAQAAQPTELPPDEAGVLSALAEGEKTVDELVATTGLDAARVMAALMLLEVKGLVRRFGGGTYARKE